MDIAILAPSVIKFNSCRYINSLIFYNKSKNISSKNNTLKIWKFPTVYHIVINYEKSILLFNKTDIDQCGIDNRDKSIGKDSM